MNTTWTTHCTLSVIEVRLVSFGNSNFQSYLIRTEKFYLFLCGRLSHWSDSAAVRSFSKIPIVRERAERELRERCPVVSCLPQSGSTPSHLLRSPLSASSLSLLRLLPSSSSRLPPSPPPPPHTARHSHQPPTAPRCSVPEKPKEQSERNWARESGGSENRVGDHMI